jgi:hypothetical protein
MSMASWHVIFAPPQGADLVVQATHAIVYMRHISLSLSLSPADSFVLRNNYDNLRQNLPS